MLFTFEILLLLLVFMLFFYVEYYQPVTFFLYILVGLVVVIFYIKELAPTFDSYLETHEKTRVITGIAIMALLFMFAIIILGIIMAALSYFGIMPPLPKAP